MNRKRKIVLLTVAISIVLTIFFLPVFAAETPTPSPELSPIESPIPTTTLTIVPTITLPTEEASVSANLQNEVNTTTVGSNVAKEVIHVTEESTENVIITPTLTESSDEAPLDVPEKVQQINNTLILEDNIVATVDTGSVSRAGSESSIQTADASVKINIAHIGNTTLIGSCGFFGIINLFAPQNGDLLLPNEEDFIVSDNCNSASFSANLNPQQTVTVNNTLEINTKLNTAVDTGNNEATVINTGSGEINVKTLDIANTTFIGSGWIYISINDLGSWTGKIVGARGEVTREERLSTVQYHLPAQTKNNTPVESIVINNDALVNTNVTAAAATGNNFIPQDDSSVNSGNASIDVNMFNLLNTTIVGNNWYYALISNFSEFKGNIIIPRPDLSVTIVANTQEIELGKEVVVTALYRNAGMYPAKDSKIQVQIPDSFSLLSAEGGRISENSVSWNLGNIDPGSTGTVSFRVMLAKVTFEKPTFTVSILTASYEPLQNNNSASLSIFIKQPGSQNATKIVPSPTIAQIYNPVISDLYYPVEFKRRIAGTSQLVPEKIETHMQKSGVKGAVIRNVKPRERTLCSLGLIGCSEAFLPTLAALFFFGIVKIRRRKLFK